MIFGQRSEMSHDWEILSSFFSIQNIEPHWLDCHLNPGLYDEEQGRWTGCFGKVGHHIFYIFECNDYQMERDEADIVVPARFGCHHG